MSKEDELAKEQAEVVPNTYGDLHDAPVEYIGEGAGIKTIPQDTVITSQGKRTSANCLIINSSLLFSKLI